MKTPPYFTAMGRLFNRFDAWLRMAPLWLLLLGSDLARPQEIASIATYHWTYEYLQQLGLRQRLPGTMLMTLPLNYRQVAAAIDSAKTGASSSAERFWIETTESVTRRPNSNRPWLQAGSGVIEKAGRIQSDDLRSRLAVRTHFGIFPDRHLALYNVINLDQELLDDPRYIGKRWRGFTGYSEQAYALLHFDKYFVKFGRDFIRWGRGRDATLLISDYSRPLDHFLGQIELSQLRLIYVAGKLNRVALSDSLRSLYNDDFCDRYLAAGRIELEPIKNRFRFAITQMVIHGGPDRNFEWYYLNPFIFYHGEQLNEDKNGNTLGALDFVARPSPGLELYGQLLIDDVQIEKTRSGDLEPNEIAYLFGAQVADPLGAGGTTVGLEYTRVANRTYNTILEWEKFLHRNRPLAHFLGNDFDRWLLHGRTYFGRKLQLYAIAELLRRGEGRIEAPFDRPWLNYSLEEGYSEKFPSGVVETSRHLRLEARWQPRAEIFLAVEGQFSRYKNFANGALGDESKNTTSFFLRLWWEKDWWLPLGN